MIESDKYFELAREKWHTKTGLFYALFAGILFPSALPIAWTKPHAALSTFIALATLIVWLHAQKTPKPKKGRIGFAISVSCSDKYADQRVSEDFISQLQSLIKSGNSGRNFEFIVIPKHLSIKDQDVDKAKKLADSCGVSFLIFCRLRIRNIGGQDTHVFDLGAVARHAPLSTENAERFSAEFGELFPGRINFPKENDLLSFEFVSTIASTIAKYLIGIAALLSRDFNYSELMYLDVGKDIVQSKISYPAFTKISERLPQRFFEVNFARARDFYAQWKKDKSSIHAEYLGDALEKIPPMLFQNTTASLRAIYSFISTGKTDECLKLLKSNQQTENDVWNYNIAFLYGFDGKLSDAIRHYRKGASLAVSDDEAIADIEDFLTWSIAKYPNKIQLIYCLAFFNWKVRGDLALAIKGFDEFIEKSSCFRNEVKLATKWRGEIYLAIHTATQSVSPS